MALQSRESDSNKNDSQEGITVAIRMRPLNNVEENKRRIWKVLPKYSSVAQTTRDGKPLPERITGRTFFTFDKTFGEQTNNTQVYDGVAKGIVNSVVEGLNGTIFAYGQTSSGKTYTMQGAGNLEQGLGGEGGIVHMAANDIFSQITKKQERNFLVRVSFLEIYNEEVRDLLGDTSQTLKIREDPRRGVFVQSEEEIVTNFDDLLKVLVHGDKSRTFASTGMNERSSRSHTILRITIESREKGFGEDDDENRNPSSDGAIRISTLNLVDLAGSESVRHTGATGDRQKEGGLINQSLLTLSRVIVALGSPNEMHINFRDSKLTRILQPSLSGNARMAVICCATPSELYIEETRSTLQFASRAKLVKTNAQVNEVLDDQSMIRRLQKELAEARRNQTGPGQGQVRDLEAKVATAGTQAMEAKKKLDRLKACILNSGYNIIGQGTIAKSDAAKKRRKSDGPLLLGLPSPAKDDKVQAKSPNTAPRRKKTKVLQHQKLDIKQELKLVQEALATRNIFVRDLNQTLDKCSEEIKQKNSDVERMSEQNNSLNEENIKSKADVSNLQEMVASLKQTLDTSVTESKNALAEKDSTIMESFKKLQQTLRENEDSQKDNEDLITQLTEVENEKNALKQQIATLQANANKEKEDFEAQINDLKSNIDTISSEKDQTESNLASVELNAKKEKEDFEAQLDDLKSSIEDISNEKDQTEANLATLEQNAKKEKEAFEAQLNDLKSSIEDISSEKDQTEANLKGEIDRLNDVSKKLHMQVQDKESHIVAKKGEINSLSQQKKSLDDACKQSLVMIATLRNEKSSLATQVMSLQEETAKNQQEIESTKIAGSILSEKLKEAEEKLCNLRESNNLVTKSSEESIQSLKLQIAAMEQNLEEEKASKLLLQNDLQTAMEAGKQIEMKLHTLSTEQTNIVSNHHLQMTSAQEQMARMQSQYDAVSAEKENLLEKFEEQVRVYNSESQELQNNLECTQKKLVEKEAECAQLVEEKKSLEERIHEVEDIHTATVEELNSNRETATKAIEGQFQQSTTQIQELQSKCAEKDSEIAKLNNENISLQSNIQQMEGAVAERDSTLCELHAAIQEMEEISAVKDLNLEKLSAEKEKSNSQLQQHYREKVSSLEAVLNNMESTSSDNEKLQADLLNKDAYIQELETSAVEMKNQSDIQNNEIESLLTNLMEVTSEKQQFESSYVEMKNSCEALSAENEAMHARVTEIDERNTDIELELEALRIESRLLSERNSSLEVFEKSQAETNAALAEYEEEVNDLSEQINTIFMEATYFKEQNDELQSNRQYLESQIEAKHADFVNLQFEVNNMSAARKEMIRALRTCETERDEAKRENHNLENTCEMLEKRIRDREAERDEATLELKRLYDENRELNEQMGHSLTKDKEEELRGKIQELTNQNLELKHLLASVNESEERLRNAVKTAESNFMAKTNELEDAQYRISEIEQELSAFQSAGAEMSQVEQSKTELVNGIETIQQEKEELEHLLQEERGARMQLQQQMGDEQRALLQEGENMMAELRRKLEETEKKFSESEADAYNARQLIDEINDEKNRLEERYLEASAQLNSSDSSKQRQEARITELETDLNNAKSESYALKESIIDMKEKMRRSTRDSEKAIRESEIASSELTSMRRKLSNLENLNETHQLENSKLKKKIKQSEENTELVEKLQEDLENKENELDTAEKEISALKLEIEKNSGSKRVTRSMRSSKPSNDENEIQTMRNELEEMKDEIKQKDKRIKKLEAVRLTKDRLAHISKMKAENQKYEKKCTKMEKEIERLQNTITSMESDGGSSTEITELRSDKDALEKKLRKFATHCQRLEDDKAGIEDALRSCEVDIESHDGDITDAIIHLCDKFATTEEALEREKKNSSFDKEKLSFERKIQSLTERLNQYEYEKSELEAQLENAEKNTSVVESEEHREKLRFLEQENLQLMQDVKSTKRQLQAAREEVVTLRMNVDQNPTADFNFGVPPRSRKDSISSSMSSKEDSDTMELTNLAEACTSNESAPVLRRSSRKKRSVLGDNTNGSLNEERRNRSSTGGKRQKVNALFDTKHAMNPTGNLSRGADLAIENAKAAMNRAATPGLGESSSLDTENTGECKQS